MKTASRSLTLFCALAIAALPLSGCDKAKGLFGDDKAPPLKGERISILELQRDLVANPALKDVPVALPDPWVNQFWPQAGGYPNHALGHLALGGKLKQAWKVSIGDGGDKRTPLIAQPVVAEGAVFTLDTDNRVRAFDLKSGKLKWESNILPPGEKSAGAMGGGLAYSTGKLYAANGYESLTALDPSSGKIDWRAAISSPARAAPTVMDDRVYIVTLDNHLIVLSATDGAPLWSYAGVSETTNLLGSASPAADATLAVLPLSSGEIFGLRPDTGRVVWEDNLSAVRRTGSLASITDIRGLPVIDQGVVYAVSFSGRMVALDQVTGRRIWQREIGSTETPWAAGENVFILTAEQQLAALTRAAGDTHWVTQLPRFEDKDKDKPVVWAGPVLAGGRLFVVSSGGEMDEISAQDGHVMSRINLGAETHIPPVVAANTLLVLTNDGQLSAWR